MFGECYHRSGHNLGSHENEIQCQWRASDRGQTHASEFWKGLGNHTHSAAFENLRFSNIIKENVKIILKLRKDFEF